MHGVYLLADESVLPWRQLQALMPELLETGLCLVQHRAKALGPDARGRHARQLQRLCAAAGVPLLVNDDPALAVEIGAAGVHLGAGDGDPVRARRLLGDSALIGRSCYASLTQAQTAIEAGCDYVSFGRLFHSTTKPAAPAADLDVIRQAAARLSVPVCGIGGIDGSNASAVRDAGAHMLACAGGILAQSAPAAAARRLVAIMAPPPQH